VSNPNTKEKSALLKVNILKKKAESMIPASSFPLRLNTNNFPVSCSLIHSAKNLAQSFCNKEIQLKQAPFFQFRSEVTFLFMCSFEW